MSDKKIIEINEYISIQVEFIEDNNWQFAEENYGKYDDKPSKWAIDCYRGWLLGEQENQPEMGERLEELDYKYYYNYPDHPVGDDYNSLTDEEAEEYTSLYDKWDKDCSAWNNSHGYKVLADVRQSCYDPSRSYQFFHPEYSKYLLNEEKATELTQEQIDIIIKQYKRMVELNEGWWGYIGIEVTLLVNGDEIAEESLWGIESDDKEYRKEVVKELVEGVAERVGLEIDDEISAVRTKIFQLEISKNQIPTEESIIEKVMQEF